MADSGAAAAEETKAEAAADDDDSDTCPVCLKQASEWMTCTSDHGGGEHKNFQVCLECSRSCGTLFQCGLCKEWEWTCFDDEFSKCQRMFFTSLLVD